MGQILSYSIVTSVILAILYLMYKWLFSGEKQPRYNRAVLWSVYLMAFAAVPVTDAIISYAAASRQSGDAGIEIGTITASIVESADNVPHLAWLATIYLAGLLAATLLTLFTAFRLARIIRPGRHIHKEGYTVVLTDDSATAPFSWGRYMVMNEADYGDGVSPVVLHERAHIERRHWVDLLAGQLVAIFQWYNPAAWLMREEMKALHEYQADAAVLDSGADARSYQMLLIKKAVGARFPSLANSLNHSKLKKHHYDVQTKIIREQPPSAGCRTGSRPRGGGGRVSGAAGSQCYRGSFGNQSFIQRRRCRRYARCRHAVSRPQSYDYFGKYRNGSHCLSAANQHGNHTSVSCA